MKEPPHESAAVFFGDTRQREKLAGGPSNSAEKPLRLAGKKCGRAAKGRGREEMGLESFARVWYNTNTGGKHGFFRRSRAALSGARLKRDFYRSREDGKWKNL